MPTPRYEELFGPLVQALQQLGGEAPTARLDEAVARLLWSPDRPAPASPVEAAQLRDRLTTARRYLKAAGLIESPRRGVWRLTGRGRAAEQVDPAEVKRRAEDHRRRGEGPPPDRPPPAGRPLLQHSAISEALTVKDPEQRRALQLPDDDATPTDIVVELNLRHEKGLAIAARRFQEVFDEALGRGQWDARRPVLVANTYFSCRLSVNEVRKLVRHDQHGRSPNQRAIFRVWPDFPVRRLTDRSVSTVKGDAARRSYDASGRDIAWAVIDSGIDAAHPHFRTYDTLGGDVAELHRDFTRAYAPDDVAAQIAAGLTDAYGHGTHVAGIIAGGLPPQPAEGQDLHFCVGQRVVAAEEPADSSEIAAELLADVDRIDERPGVEPARLTGVAPRCKLVSLKVLDDTGQSKSTDVIRALQYVREEVNGNGKLLRIHGVNLSLGYEFNAKWFACGQSPLCVEVDKLVRSGVVVVVAAGNTGYGSLRSREGLTSTALSLTINDPGNAALGITVGSTHRDMPHTYGVSYFSSKGPTGDGRLKPDLVAPGERITSCAAGQRLQEIAALYGGTPPPGAAAYIDDSGTSMAAPHVSGAIAAFLSIRREFTGQPERVKQIFLETATSLGRERYFEGHGLVDLMRAIQSV